MGTFLKPNLWRRLESKINRYENKFPTGYRKGLVRLIVFCVGELFRRSLHTPPHHIFSKPSNRLKVVLFLNGGLGDAIINIQYVRKLATKLENSSDVFVYMEGSGSWEKKTNARALAVVDALFGCNPEFFPKNVILRCNKSDIKCADLVIRAFINYPIVFSANQKRIHEKDEWLEGYIAKLQDFVTKHVCARYRGGESCDPFAFRYLARIFGKNFYSSNELKAEIPVTTREFRLICRISEREIREKIGCPGAYITLQRGIGTKDDKEGIRNWSVESYESFVKKFKETFPRVKVVQVGSVNTARINGVDVDMRGETSFEELKALLKSAVFHLDGECGLVHLKHVLGGRSIVLFGPTSESYKGYSDNVNIKNRPSCCKCACENILGDGEWETRCILTGTAEATCMENITSDLVLEACVKNFGQELSQNA